MISAWLTIPGIDGGISFSIWDVSTVECYQYLVVPSVLSRFGCRSFRVSGPTIWNDLSVDIRSTDITREQFKRSLKIWLFECVYGRRRIWETVQSEGAPKKWTYLLTYLLTDTSASVSVTLVCDDVLAPDEACVFVCCCCRWLEYVWTVSEFLMSLVMIPTYSLAQHRWSATRSVRLLADRY